MAHSLLISCPVCGKQGAERYRPFCSSRCANIDLGRWLGETYRTPTDDEPEFIELPRRSDGFT